jgi:hypothetical protein
MNILPMKEFQEPAELPNTHPLNQRYMLLECRIGLVSESGSDDFLNAGVSRCVRD